MRYATPKHKKALPLWQCLRVTNKRSRRRERRYRHLSAQSVDKAYQDAGPVGLFNVPQELEPAEGVSQGPWRERTPATCHPRVRLDVISSVGVTRYTVTRYDSGNTMAAAERMKAMRDRWRARGLRELRLVVPDARSKAIRRRVAKEVAGLDPALELAALGWIEAVSEFDRG